MADNLAAVRAAIVAAKIVAAEFHTGTASFYEDGNTTPVLVSPCRVKKAKPSAFDAGNQTRWGTKRDTIIKLPQNATTGVIKKGWIVQVSTPDGDPTINQINFTVLSAVDSQFSAERNVSVVTEVLPTPRII